MATDHARVQALLEQIEAEQINLGLYSTQVGAQQIADRAVELGQLNLANASAVLTILQALSASHEVLEWKSGLFRSRISETARILRLVRQRLWYHEHLEDSALLIEDIRVAFRQRHRPDRDASLIGDILPNDLSPELRTAFLDAVGFTTCSAFQARALEQLYATARGGNPTGLSYVIAGDTGAGKTEAFLFPILLDIANEPPAQRQLPGVRAVLMYPRIRLARNQLARLLRYTGRLASAGGPLLTIGIQNQEIPANRAAIQGGRYGKGWEVIGNRVVVPLIETCVSCPPGPDAGRYLLDLEDSAVETGAPALTCSVCNHTIRNLFITQSALKQAAPDLLVITDISLSQWLARECYTHLWGCWAGDTVTVPPRYLVLDEVHLYEQIKGAHIARLIKRFVARTQLAHQHTTTPDRKTTVIGVSATLNDEQRFMAKLLDVAPASPELNRIHVIKPKLEELVDTDGRERYLFLYPRSLSPTPRSPEYRVTDNTAAIQTIMAVMHNLKNKSNWRGLAFFDSINGVRQFEHDYTAPRSNRNTLPGANTGELWRLRTDQVNADKQNPPKYKHSQCGSCDQRERDHTLGECPYFQNGDCWIFAHLHGWNQKLRVATSVYAGSSASLDNKDLIPTTSSLEVGYDDDHIQLVYQHKAPPNAASFIQRRGRAGRDPNDSPVIVTLLWPHKREDAFYYFHPEALYAPSYDDAPLNAGNFTVQRTHALLAFFDLLACLRRQNIDGLRDDPAVYDFSDMGNANYAPASEVVKSFSSLNDPKQLGQQRFVLEIRNKPTSVWFNGKPVSNGWVQDQGNHLIVRGWLAMDKGLGAFALHRSWQRIQGAFRSYITDNKIVSSTFASHRTYPFRQNKEESLPTSLISQFGNKERHAYKEGQSGHWIQSFTLIDWMLQGKQDATTLTVHYPAPAEADSPDVTVEVNYAITEFVPGNISYRLREDNTIHWTPIPPNGMSTFLYPEEDVLDEQGEVTGQKQPIASFLPVLKSVAFKRDSIFGVPKRLNEAFPGLNTMMLRRVRVEPFSRPSEHLSPTWFYDPAQECAVSVPRGISPPDGASAISRRSRTRVQSVIIPYVAAQHQVDKKQVVWPFDLLFGAISGYLEEGRAMLGYTNVCYELTHEIKTEDKKKQATLRRYFYPPQPETDEAGQPKPVMLSYDVETHGLAFEINTGLLGQVVAAVHTDNNLRIRLRRQYTQYLLTARAEEFGLFPGTLMRYAQVITDYWLDEVVPNSDKTPRGLEAADVGPLLHYYRDNRNISTEDLQKAAQEITTELLTGANPALRTAFQDTVGFADFIGSVLLHSLASLLKQIIARLGGVSGDALVAYADLPLLDNVDQTVTPRILLMDTVEGGSGGIAQAFDRLDLTDSEGSLWWMLRTGLGNCPIAAGQMLLRNIMTLATREQIEAVIHADDEAIKLEELGKLLDLHNITPPPAARQQLGTALFNDLYIGSEYLKPALMLHELYAVQGALEHQRLGPVEDEATVRRLVRNLNSTDQPEISKLKAALQKDVNAANLEYELGLQLLALFHNACDDSCPVCLGEGSDVEVYYLAPYLNSRRILRVLAGLLQKDIPTASCVSEVTPELLQNQSVRVAGNPGDLGDSLSTERGLAIVNDTDEKGQVTGAIITPINPEDAREFLTNRDGWEKRWADGRRIRVDDQTTVRSRAEFIIATRLKEHEIPFEYETALPYMDGQKRRQYIHPDFYLFEHDVYIEYWGKDDPEYLEERKFKERIYQQRNIFPVSIEKDEVDGDFIPKIFARIQEKS